ncbi:pseudoazurin [Marivita hallyeonensis]|uniref:Pseudoazurin n=1 Tax=Marivita hallyeonensis TaxID=996342 RepID=A0A1M5WHG3_9RHOB|nr:pseudoazurin [Marivita hallyeonensis]SHH86952.1 pseudoazurin [Marivita hallyeonensis]
MPFHLPRRHFLMTASAASAALLLPRGARAQETLQIEMLNRHPEDRTNMVFYPDIIVAQPGDTVRFVATDRGHNTVSVDGMLPEGVEEWRGRINEEIELTVETPGFYGYVCQPHVSMGMAGIIVVEGEGKMDNYEAAKSVQHRPRRLQEKFNALFAQIEADGLAST